MLAKFASKDTLKAEIKELKDLCDLYMKSNPDYDKKAKKGTPESYAMSSIRDCFDFFLIKENGSVSFKLKDHINLAGGTAVTAFAREWTPESK